MGIPETGSPYLFMRTGARQLQLTGARREYLALDYSRPFIISFTKAAECLAAAVSKAG